MTITEGERWLLSFYRTSEIQGALFFGRLARALKAGAVQADMTKHFADESMHAHLWTACMRELDVAPQKLREGYQDQYVEAGGMPVNMMEILAVTLVFERRVISQYVAHSKVPDLAAPIRATLDRIMDDERWHIQWVSGALKDMEREWGADEVAGTLDRYTQADREVYQRTLAEHDEVLHGLMRFREK